jgi:O-antigen ligase
MYFTFSFWQSRRNKDKELSKKIILIFLLFVVYCSLFTVLAWSEISSRFQISPTEQSVSLRAFYNQVAFSIIKEHPWLGIGFGNFVWETRQMLDLLSSWIHQPVHNLYLLIANETGLLGLVVFLVFIWRLLRQFNGQFRSWAPNKLGIQLLTFIVFAFLFIALFDHFFWTLQQGQLVFWLALGLMAGQASRKRKDSFPQFDPS